MPKLTHILKILEEVQPYSHVLVAGHNHARVNTLLCCESLLYKSVCDGGVNRDPSDLLLANLLVMLGKLQNSIIF